MSDRAEDFGQADSGPHEVKVTSYSIGGSDQLSSVPDTLFSRIERIRPIYFHSVAVILVLVASAKIYSAFGDARILNQPDPLFLINNRVLMILVAAVELGVAAVIFFNRSQIATRMSVFWLSTNFIVYRMGLWYLGAQVCPCLGNITDQLPIGRGTIDGLLKIVVLYCFAGSGVYLYSAIIRGSGLKRAGSLLFQKSNRLDVEGTRHSRTGGPLKKAHLIEALWNKLYRSIKRRAIPR